MNKKYYNVIIVTLTYNHPHNIENFLQSILNLKNKQFCVLIIDNGSTQEIHSKYIRILKKLSLNYNYFIYSKNKFIGKINPEVKFNLVYSKDENLGFSGGNNLGFKFIKNFYISDFIWLLNDDTFVHEDSLDELIKHVQNKKKICGSLLLKMISGKRTNIIQTIGAGKLNKILGNSVFITSNSNYRIDYIVGASVFMPYDIIKDNLLFDENFFLYWEDVDFSLRAKKLGYTLSVLEKAKVWHVEGGSNQKGILKDYYWVRNGLYLAYKHYPYFLPIIFFSYFIKHTIIRLLKKENLNFKAYLYGIKHFLQGKMGRYKGKELIK